jgi:hypothetical protein
MKKKEKERKVVTAAMMLGATSAATRSTLADPRAEKALMGATNM